MKFLLLTPPLTQLNTPYPATTVLKGFLQQQGYSVDQSDMGIELVDKIFSPAFLKQMFQDSVEHYRHLSGESQLTHDLHRIYSQQQQYIDSILPVMRFLRGSDLTLAPLLASRHYLPEGPRFDRLADLDWAFGSSGTDDRARHLATLFVEDLADYIRETTDPHFDLIRYAEQLSSYAPTFDPLEIALRKPLSIIDNILLQLLQQHVQSSQPSIVGFSIPFPGCLYGALRCAQWLRQNHPDITVVFGGGFPNTEWRQLTEPRLFDYCHYVTLDDGELPLLRLAEQKQQQHIDTKELVRTYYLQGCEVQYSGNDDQVLDFGRTGIPDFTGLPLHLYISMAEMINPMQRLWSNGRWNKMMMAHGCYWAGCAFCDTGLDYIGRYSAPSASVVVDRMEAIAGQTGISGFHFVDEALPPKLLEEVCHEILARHLTFTFWGNIRFEKIYTTQLCQLMAQAGCIAVSGGLEVAGDRLLTLLHKGVTVRQTTEVARHFHQAGIMVHTYLMYGFPSETLQETVNALEIVRRLFADDLVQSAFWHRYAMTCHSPSGRNPQQYGVCRTSLVPNPFCNNEVDFYPQDGAPDSPLFPYDIDAVGEGLRFATYNFMNGVGFDMPIHRWFSIQVPKPKV